MPVMLARMEGTLNLVAERIAGLSGRVDRHDTEIDDLQAKTQALELGAKAEATKAIALAQALKEADEARRVKSETTWTPFAKTMTALGAGLAVVSVFLQTYR